MGQCISEVEEGCISRSVARLKKPLMKKRKDFNFWKDMPGELRMEILSYLRPKELVRCSTVSKAWHGMCFDGQLWSNLDTSEYYQDITADALVRIIATAGPFVRDLNLRGCVQLREKWNNKGLADACTNLENFSLEGCLIDRSSIHCFLLANNRLVHINLSGLAGATNAAMRIIGEHCPRVEHLNVTWCNNIDTKGLRRVVQGCPNLRDLRAGEVRGWDDISIMTELFTRNTLERLILTNCDSLNDDSLTALVEGVEGEYDFLTGRVIVPPRRLKHLDLTRCRSLTDTGVKALAHNLPYLEGLQLSKCHALTDSSMTTLLPTLPMLTHLDLEELDTLTNATLQSLASAPCTKYLQHLSISYCENLGDAGMLPILKACSALSSLDMDNTRISDLVLTECAALIRSRNRIPSTPSHGPKIGLRIVAYDCANITWTSIREILSRNAECQRLPHPTYPREVIGLKCFYNWQPTVDEHTKRVLRGDFAAASRLERKWAAWMMLSEEVGVGAGGRRRRRRAREAQLLHEDESEEAGGGGGVGPAGAARRRRARSGPAGCVVM
jgi:F-box/leucine-rich repeat protein 2/20